MDVAIWLRRLGLERYEQAFRDNDVDSDLLPRLTSQDLEDIGVASVGHRRRLLDAIAAPGAQAINRRSRTRTNPRHRQRQVWTPSDAS